DLEAPGARVVAVDTDDGVLALCGLAGRGEDVVLVQREARPERLIDLALNFGGRDRLVGLVVFALHAAQWREARPAGQVAPALPLPALAVLLQCRTLPHLPKNPEAEHLKIVFVARLCESERHRSCSLADL